MNAKEVLFGQVIYVEHKLVRISVPKNWRDRKWIAQRTKEKEVHVIGFRSLKNGYVDGDRTDGFFFIAKENINALLVTENLRTKPFYVLNTLTK
jgi:hypothetical protein